MPDDQPLAIYGIRVVSSDVLPPGEVWMVAPPKNPKDILPQVVRLVDLEIPEIPDGDTDA